LEAYTIEDRSQGAIDVPSPSPVIDGSQSVVFLANGPRGSGFLFTIVQKSHDASDLLPCLLSTDLLYWAGTPVLPRKSNLDLLAGVTFIHSFHSL
jgi:hypothetical protein